MCSEVCWKLAALHYNYFRTYVPATGRYLESDSIGLDAGPNTYAYVANNPLAFVDPDGLRRRTRSNSAGFYPLEFPRGGVGYVWSQYFGMLYGNSVLQQIVSALSSLENERMVLAPCEVAFYTMCWRKTHKPGGFFTTEVVITNFRRQRGARTPKVVDQGPGFSWQCADGQFVGVSGNSCCMNNDVFPLD